MEGYRSKVNNFQGYPGHIMLMKLRYGYGNQSHNEKMEILHSWYSDLRAYLPVLYEKEPTKYTEDKQWNSLTIQDLMEDANRRLDIADNKYDPAFEGLATRTPEEKEFNTMLKATKEVLDEITAITKILNKRNFGDDDDGGLVAG